MSPSHRIALVVSFLWTSGVGATTKLILAAAGPTRTSVAYKCDGATVVMARYDTSSPVGGAILGIAGHVLEFHSAISGSGARYTPMTRPTQRQKCLDQTGSPDGASP